MNMILRLVGILVVVALFSTTVEVYAQPDISEITPDTGINAGTIGVIITGSGFVTGATVSLVQVDISIIGSPTTVIEPNTITTTFDLTEARIGSWSVVVTNPPDNQSGTLTDGFRIIPAEFPPLLGFTKSVTPDIPVSPGGTLTYTLSYENIGQGTATNVVLTDLIPVGTTYITDSANGVGTAAYSHDGGMSYDGYQTTPVTNIRWEINTPLVPRGSGNAVFKVKVE